MPDTTKLEIKKSVAVLCLNRPEKHNAFDDLVISELRGHLATVSESDARVLVLKAEGKNFCAGADLSWMKRMAKLSHQENIEDAQNLATLLRELNDLPIPTIAQVQGAAYGGAIGLIACCDIALADKSARFCLSETKLGLAPATIGPYVVEAIGARIARKLFLTAEVFHAEEALSYQLLHKIVEPDDLPKEISKTINQILATGPMASRAAKKLVADIIDSPADLIDRTSRLIADLRVSEEGQTGLSSFFAKEPAPWVIEQD